MEFGGVMIFTEHTMRPAALARALEERGFESLFVPAHTHIPILDATVATPYGPLTRPYFEIMDPFLALTAAAGATSRLRVGTGICLVNQRDPIVTAKIVSTLDVLSEGRFLFGVGNGWFREEIANHGTPFAERHKIARERIEAMVAIWTHDEASYQGEHVRFGPIAQWPKPVQKPHPPIIVGGLFPHAARRAIRYGDGWIPRVDRLDEDELGTQIRAFHAMATEAGRDPAALPVTVFRVPEEIDRLRVCRDLGVARAVFTLPSEPAATLLPILDRWVALRRQLNG
jgi:probable F420-dependent oxidoreductase